MTEKKAFGLTLEEIALMHKSIKEWRDSNSPARPVSSDDFFTALDKGSDLLLEDETLKEIFSINKH